MSGTISIQVVLYSLLATGILRLVEGSSECAQTSFKCTNGKCVHIDYVCDGQDKCGDNSDEKVCDPIQCHPAAHHCPDGKCIARRSICDRANDCVDNSDEQMCEPFQCHPSAFQCSNGNCISRFYFCYSGDQCGDNSDQRYCNIGTNDVCPQGWSKCANNTRCFPSHWMCDKYPDCPDGSDEKNCDKNTVSMSHVSDVNTKLKSYLLSRRKAGSRSNRWGSQVHRIAVSLHLADNTTFISGNSTGEEIRYELMMQLLYRIPRNKLSSQELAMYIHAMLVSCLDPRDFYGGDLVRELRRRVEATDSYTNPFLILVLCNAGDTMTAKDVERVTAAHDAQQRPFWTDAQALSSMALSCIASHNSGLVDERTLTDLLQELKKRQFRNGTVDNFRTTALVTQALFIHNSYKKDFDLDLAKKVLADGLNESMSLMNAYYTLPVLYGKSLLNVSSSHCRKQPVEEEEALQKALDVHGETITVQYSVWMGEEVNVGRTWRLRMLANSTIYDAIETAAKIDNRQKVQYNVVDGKPYVSSLNGKEDDPEMGTFWFIYLKSLNSDEKPTFVEQSPVDINLTPNQEIILWYKRAPWNGQNLIQKPETSA